MSISSRFAVGIHILTLIEMNKNQACSSEFIAGSVNTNPVVIRKIIGMLKKAGILEVRSGIAGANLTKKASDITMLDIYKAVNVVEENKLFNVHETPNPDCVVGKNIQGVVEPLFQHAQHAMEKVLGVVTLEDILLDVTENEANT